MAQRTQNDRGKAGAAAAASPGPVPNPGIKDTPLYQAGKAKIGGHDKVLKLSSNENPFGPSPKAREAYQRALAEVERYPDGASTELREALAAKHGIDAARIIVGAGSDEILHYLGHSYLNTACETIYSEHTFDMYRVISTVNGAKAICVPERDWKADVAGMIAAMSEKTRMLFLANPDNPTGSYLSAAEVVALYEALPPEAIFVHDEAYSEYNTAEDALPGFAFVDGHENFVVTRTFSKIYGLAGLRVGWAYAPPAIADVLNRLKGPFNVSNAGQAAALAALADEETVAQTVAHNAQWRAWLSQQFAGMGLTVLPSAANFVTMLFSDEPGLRAQDANAFLLERGIILRHLPGQGMPQALRMTVGREEDNRLVVAAMAEFLSGARGA